jgi:hypothetical protein
VSLIFNERQKLLANNFDRMSTACFTVGIATPLAGYLYNIGNFANMVRLANSCRSQPVGQLLQFY